MNNAIGFSRARLPFIYLSACLLVGGIVTTVVRGGFNYGIDFRAGVEQRVTISESDATVEDVRVALEELSSIQVRSLGEARAGQFIIRVQDPGTTDNFVDVTAARILELLRERFESVEETALVYVGARFSARLTQQVSLLTSLALGLILIYLWFRFRLGFAVSAIVALLHDLGIMLVFIGVTQIEISTATVAAVLTIIGYSLNDTIVIFDRIRENEELLREMPYSKIIDASITQSLSRTLITSLTTMLAVVAIYIFSTGTVQNFALNMIVGIVVGTYSSIFIASPTLATWHVLMQRRIASQRSKKLESGLRGSKIAAGQAGGESAPVGLSVGGAISSNAVINPADVEAVKRAISQRRKIVETKRSSGAKKRRKRSNR